MILNIVFYYFIIFALTQGISLGLVSSYMVVKRWSMLGDIMSHAALPGIVVAFFLTHSTSLLVLIGGGLVSALLSALCSFFLQRKGNFPRESNFALILSWFFSFGIIMMNVIQKQSIPGQSILNSFIFGNILMINHTDVIYYVIYTVLFSFFMIFFSRKKEFFAFDNVFSFIRYRYVFLWEIIFLILSTLTIIIALQSVGILLIGGLTILPGSCAKLISHSYKEMMFWAVVFSIISFLCGIVIAFQVPYLPTGPIIILVSVLIFLILFSYKLFGKRR
jgi:manganese/zinc/iron transport system permease protein